MSQNNPVPAGYTPNYDPVTGEHIFSWKCYRAEKVTCEAVLYPGADKPVFNIETLYEEMTATDVRELIGELLEWWQHYEARPLIEEVK